MFHHYHLFAVVCASYHCMPRGEHDTNMQIVSSDERKLTVDSCLDVGKTLRRLPYLLVCVLDTPLIGFVHCY